MAKVNRRRGRRRFVRFAGAGLLGVLAGEYAIVRAAALASSPNPFRSIESAVGGRVGVMALDTGSGKSLQSRPDDRFPLCSTFKWPLAAAILSRAEAGALSLDERMSLEGVEFNSPVKFRLQDLMIEAMGLETGKVGNALNQCRNRDDLARWVDYAYGHIEATAGKPKAKTFYKSERKLVSG